MATPAPSFTTTSSSSLGAVGQLTPTTTTTSASNSSTTTNFTGTTAVPPPKPGSGGNNSNSNTTTNAFQFPREYHFPPFFTRQPNLSTRHSQFSKWSSLILSYCAYHRLFKLSLTSPHTEELFYNRRIDRRLSLADAREVLEFMRRDGRVEFIAPNSGSSRGLGGIGSLGGIGVGVGGGDEEGGGGGGGDVVWVYWRTPEEWAALLEAWVDETAQKGTVLTLYELSQGEGTIGTEFHGLDLELLQKALQVLVKRNKAQIFGQEDQLGVKFF
ncbi:ESCRT-II complex subunit-domain-containing protein [Xylaria sp. FL0933]|nr:ESCRT-II complex subunit-domain-containing protein [Xylaria sp. FL0933]